MAYKQDIQIRSCLFKLYLQVWLVSRTSVAREPCKCRSRAVQVSNKWIASIVREPRLHHTGKGQPASNKTDRPLH